MNIEEEPAVGGNSAKAWDIDVAEMRMGVSGAGHNVHVAGSFGYRQNNSASQEDCDRVLAVFLLGILEDIEDAKSTRAGGNTNAKLGLMLYRETADGRLSIVPSGRLRL